MSQVEGPKRLEAEYYQPLYLENQNAILRSGLPVKRLHQLCKRVTDGSHVTPEYQETGVRFLMVRNLHEQRIDFDDVKFITPEMDRFLKQCKPAPGDILLTKVGTIGISAIVPADAPDFNIFVSLAVIKGVPTELRAYLSTLLKTRFCRLQAERAAKGISQPDLHIEDIREFLIPEPLGPFLDRIAAIIGKAHLLLQESSSNYDRSQSLLAAELGLNELELPAEGMATRRIGEVTAVGRFDAEYFHPQKAYVQAWLSDLPGKSIRDYFQSVREIYNPPARDTGHSILNFDLTDALRYFVDEDRPVVSEDEIGSIKKRISRSDVMVSRLRSYLREVALVDIPQNVGAVASSEFIVLRQRSEAVYPGALMVYLRSEPVQTILKWSQDGSNHPRFQEEELLAIKLPDRVIALQDDIRKLIQSGIVANRTAKRLLAEAKAEVERIIGEGNT